MLTRDTVQILLNELHVLCMEAADHYQAAASNPSIADMESFLSHAATEYQAYAADLAAYIRMHDDQPKLPDPDKETLDLLFTSIKTKLAADERQVLIEKQTKIEQRLSDAIGTALQSSLPPEIELVLNKILVSSTAMQHSLRSQL